MHERARSAFDSNKARPVAFRKAQIAQIGYLIKDNETRLIEALKEDLGRPALETELYVFMILVRRVSDVLADMIWDLLSRIYVWHTITLEVGLVLRELSACDTSSWGPT